jgi:hypothetical protein
MKLPWLSVRARLAIWHAGVLTLIICIFSAGIFLFVGARLYADLDTQLAREFGTITRGYREEPVELKDLATHSGITLFQIVAGGSVRHQPLRGSEKDCHWRDQRSGSPLLGWIEWPSLSRSSILGSSDRVSAAIEDPLRNTPGRSLLSSRRAFPAIAWQSVEATSRWSRICSCVMAGGPVRSRRITQTSSCR